MVTPQPEHRLTVGSHHSGSHCEPAAGTDHRAWPGQDSGLSALGQWDEGSKPRSWLLAPAAGSGQLAPGSEAQSCVEDRTEQPGLAEEGTEDDRNHVKYKHRNQTTSDSKNNGFHSLCDVGQRLPLHPNLLSVISKSEMTWKWGENQTRA